MSRIGKKPIEIPDGVKVELKGNHMKVKGALGELEMDVNQAIEVKIDESKKQILVINNEPEDRIHKQLHGTMRALMSNMITGVSKGFVKKMEIFGTGYNVKEQGGKLVFNIGFCHPIEFSIPKELKVVIEVPATRGNDVPAKFSISGKDKHLLGQFAADVRETRPPEPYKGKGIRYADEHIVRKVGKAFASGG